MFRSQQGLSLLRASVRATGRRYAHSDHHEAASYSKNLDLPAMKSDPYKQFGAASESRTHELHEIAGAQSNDPVFKLS